ncbi:hypothetical protein LCGC14_0918810 [marine sediment metagenome]|uniref:Uncharacterized protein n=1 Tax=marine sediment metagenome TaxID=412755 RepID=A0A0F9NRJ6_9ZZZZ
MPKKNGRSKVRRVGTGPKSGSLKGTEIDKTMNQFLSKDAVSHYRNGSGIRK